MDDAKSTVARLVAQVANFGSGEEKSLEQNCITSVFPDLREPLEWAAMTAVPITHQIVDQRFGSEADPTDQVTDLEDKMHQVFVVLMQVTEGEANDIVCNSSGMGLEAWRGSLTELPGALERWEEQVSKCRNSKDQQGRSRDIPEFI